MYARVFIGQQDVPDNPEGIVYEVVQPDQQHDPEQQGNQLAADPAGHQI